MELEAHSEEFKPKVIKVTGSVYVAIGYGLANSIMLVGKDRTVIVETMESSESARAVEHDFSKIT